jgi:hypothetical protein
MTVRGSLLRRCCHARLLRHFLALAFAFAAYAAAPVGAQLIAPDRALFSIATLRFDIYFPAELRKEAERLSSFAD